MPKSLFAVIASSMLSATGFSYTRAQQVADMIVTNANIYTVDETNPRASAMAIADGRILFVGNDRDVLVYRRDRTNMIDLEGRTVIPGIIDAHGHLGGLGGLLNRVNLVGTGSYEDVIENVVERANTSGAGEWIQGMGWDQNDWSEQAFPHHARLSDRTPENTG